MTQRQKRIAVAGATGVLGLNVVPRLLEAGFEVRALVRSERHLALMRRLGAEASVGDILAGATLAPLLAGCDVALHLATAIPRDRRAPDWSVNDRIRREGTVNLIQACRTAGVRHYVQQSVAMLQAGQGAALTDESAPVTAAPNLRSAADMEAIVRDSGLDWCILRGGWFYGPGTGLDAAWREQARRGELRIPGDGEAFVSLVHVSDMAAAAVLAARAGIQGETLAIVDDAPVTWGELFQHIAALEGQAPVTADPALQPPLASFRVSNARARLRLNWAPFYRSYRSGLIAER